MIGLHVVGTNPDWFDRLVVGNGFLPTFEEGTRPYPVYERSEYDLAGRRALIIATNHDTLGDPGFQEVIALS